MSTESRHTTPAEDRVPWNQLIAFGMGGLIPIALFNIVGQLVGLLGNISLGLSEFWLGAIMIIPRLSEAIADPIVGHMSDNTRGRWGRRRPFLLAGGLVVAVSFVAIWWVPTGDAVRDFFPSKGAYQAFQLSYILLVLLVFFTACNVFEIPHGALGLEMSRDPHERTRLFSAKSFLGNLFAMGTPWFIALANLKFFKGTGGTLVDGMRYVSFFIAAVLVPMTIWWFLSLREPGFAIAKEQKKSGFMDDIRTAIGNRTFLILTSIVFTLAMGFNFVNNFANYITIFYLYGGDVSKAGLLLGINGTVWAVTALFAVAPLNWISRRFGKRNALLVAILLMCAAQLSKIVCYRPGELFQFSSPQWLYDLWLWLDHWLWLVPAARQVVTIEAPYLVLIPTMLLSAGMLMFFTLGSSMVGDVCDEDELKTGTRTEGTYYAVFWWFIKMGTALASVVAGTLLVYTAFDQEQTATVEKLRGNIAVIKDEAAKWEEANVNASTRLAMLGEQIEAFNANLETLREHLVERRKKYPKEQTHIDSLVERTALLRSQAEELWKNADRIVAIPAELSTKADALLAQTALLQKQTDRTLFRLRAVEIALPLVLSCASIVLTLCYPLTEKRSYEIKNALKARRERQEAG